MSSWGNNDNSANAPYWAVNSTIANTTDARKVARPTAANVALLYGNTTPSVYTTGETIGLFMVDAAEEQVKEANGAKPAHSGWVLKTTGSGGRSGRVTYETLVSLASVKSDNNSDDSSFADAIITLTQPATTRSVKANTAGANSVTFSVSGTTVVPSSATLTYQWQADNHTGYGFRDITVGNEPVFTGYTTKTLRIAPVDTTENGYTVRCVVTATNAGITNSVKTATSANGVITVT
jgi:hypothetical protein